MSEILANVDLHPNTICIAELCAGFGMLGEAVGIALERLGYRAKPLVYVERDSAAAAAIVARMESAGLDQAPVWDDLATFDGRPWRGIVDCLCAGLPCQPYSLAGKRLGNADHRSWGGAFVAGESGESPDPGSTRPPRLDRGTGTSGQSIGDEPAGPIVHFLRIVGECRPALVFLENVPAWVMGGHFRSVGDELCRLGYTLEDPFFLAASDVGAPHERERVFILAHLGDAFISARERDARSLPSTEARFGGEGIEHGNLSDGPAIAGGGLALCPRRRLGTRGEPSGRDGLADGCDKQLADTQRDGRGLDQPRRGSDRRAAAGRDYPQLAVAGGEGSQGTERGGAFRDEGTPARGSTAECGCELGDGDGARCTCAGSGEPTEPGRRGRLSDDGCAGVPLFPPGRGDPDDPDHPDWRAWAAVAAVDASRLPRVEPELSMVADGVAFSPADLLRIGGNGVVPLAAAYAFCALLTDAGGL